MYNVAVVGVTGAVGEQMLSILEERDFPVRTPIPLASERSRGKTVEFKGEPHPVEVLAERSFEEIDIALFSAGSGVTKEYAPRILKQGTVIVDNSSAFRYDPQIPLVVPEVNGEVLENHEGLIANPNCSTAQLVMVLEPVARAFGIKRVVVSTYQATSGAGRRARQECWDQTRAVVNDESVPDAQEFPHRIAFNAIPEIGSVLDDEHSYTREEMKMVWETRKIMEDDSIQVSPTAVRIPLLNCHGETVNIETDRPFDMETLRAEIGDFPGVEVQDRPHDSVYPTPLEADGLDEVFVGRIRRDPSLENGFNCWIVSDNLRKGAALNTIQIAEELVKQSLVSQVQPVI